MSTFNISFQYKKKITRNILNTSMSAATVFLLGTQKRVRNSCGKRAIGVRANEVLLYYHQTKEHTVKILKFGTPQTIAIIFLKIEKFDVTLHKCIQKMRMEWQTA